MKDRLLKYLKYRDVGQNAFEEFCGLSRGSINKINLGIRTDKLALIAKACPELNLRWLLLGEGEMLLKNNLNSDTSAKIPAVSIADHAQAVLIANWCDIEPVMEKVMSKVMGGK